MCFKWTITLICFLHLNASMSHVDVISQLMFFPSPDTAAPVGANTHFNILKKLCVEQRKLTNLHKCHSSLQQMVWVFIKKGVEGFEVNKH